MPSISNKTPLSASPANPNPNRAKLAFWAGFASFFVLFFLGMNLSESLGTVIFLAVDLPMLGLICVLTRRARKFGFGLLAASAIFFATALATCGRVFEIK
jgi:hypothetical protein